MKQCNKAVYRFVWDALLYPLWRSCNVIWNKCTEVTVYFKKIRLGNIGMVVLHWWVSCCIFHNSYTPIILEVPYRRYENISSHTGAQVITKYQMYLTEGAPHLPWHPNVGSSTSPQPSPCFITYLFSTVHVYLMWMPIPIPHSLRHAPIITYVNYNSVYTHRDTWRCHTCSSHDTLLTPWFTVFMITPVLLPKIILTNFLKEIKRKNFTLK